MDHRGQKSTAPGQFMRVLALMAGDPKPRTGIPSLQRCYGSLVLPIEESHTVLPFHYTCK